MPSGRSTGRCSRCRAPAPSDLEHCDRPQPCSVHDIFQRVYESLSQSLGATNLAEMAASAGGPPYPPEVRRRRANGHSSTIHAAGSKERMTDELVICRARGEHRGEEDPQGTRPHRPPGRGARAHGPQRLGQDLAGLHPDGPPRLPADAGTPPGAGRTSGAPRSGGAGQARPAGGLPGLPVPERDPRSDGRALPPQHLQRHPPSEAGRRGRREARSATPASRSRSSGS